MERIFWLFPIVFMIHEMEEIIGFRLWFEKNFDVVKKYSMLQRLYSNFSSEGFAIAVLEEYIIYNMYYSNRYEYILGILYTLDRGIYCFCNTFSNSYNTKSCDKKIYTGIDFKYCTFTN